MATAGGTRGSGPERAYAPALPAEASIILDAEESAHLVRSRRVREGDAVVLFDGVGGTRLGRLRGADPRAAEVAIEGDYPDRRPGRDVRLAVSLPEGGKTDRMLAALAELGVAEIAPLICQRTPSGRTEQAGRRAKRWLKLTREACKVNGCARAMVISAPRTLQASLDEGAVLLDPDPEAPALTDLLESWESSPWILIGPEGGFTEEEVELVRAAGAPIASISALALRTTTAAVAAAAIALGYH